MRRVAVVFLVLLNILFLCSCSDGLYINNGMPSDGTQLEAIPDNNIADTSAVSLYFAMSNEGYLLSETRALKQNTSESYVNSVINALIAGPQSEDCIALINKNTKLLSVTTNNKYVYLSFSGDLLNVPAIVNGWPDNPATAEVVYKQRRLAIYSIINTLTLSGEFAFVQLYVDVDGDGTAERITRGEAGFVGDGNENQQMDMLVRDHNYIYTPANAVSLSLELISKN
jgi:hypothetical protein